MFLLNLFLVEKVCCLLDVLKSFFCLIVSVLPQRSELNVQITTWNNVNLELIIRK